jgi:hypothetical protein
MGNTVPLNVITYSILWSYNYDELQANGHYGDLTFLVVIHDPKSDRLVRVIYLQHGCMLEAYDIRSDQSIGTAALSGKALDGTPEAFARQLKIGKLAAATGIAGDCESAHKAGSGIQSWPDSTIYFVGDARSDNLRTEHAVIFAEFGTHESWPNQSGRIIDGGGHAGKGESWLPVQIEALGAFEVAGQTNTPYLRFNGKIGVDGVSITLHTSWCWSAAFTISGDAGCHYSTVPKGFPILDTRFSDHPSPFQTMGALAWPPAFFDSSTGDKFATNVESVPPHAGKATDGSSDQPYLDLSTALTFTPGGWNLHLQTGNYGGVDGGHMTLERPMTIISWNGPVTLGTR